MPARCEDFSLMLFFGDNLKMFIPKFGTANLSIVQKPSVIFRFKIQAGNVSA
jgi:hypothetical protein